MLHCVFKKEKVSILFVKLLIAPEIHDSYKNKIWL